MALVIVDKAIYVDGERRPCGDLSDELDALRDGGSPGSFLWIGLKNPTQAEFDEVDEELQLHPLAVEDAIHGRQRAKVELSRTASSWCSSRCGTWSRPPTSRPAS